MHNAKVRNKKFELTIKDLWELYIKQNKKCALSKEPINFAQKYNNRNKTTASLDRIDSSKGYIKGNVQFVHKDINRMKSDLTENRFIELCKKVYINHVE